MDVVCMFEDCRADLGQRGSEEGETSGICDPCLTKHFPMEAEKVRAHRTCHECPDKSIKCQVVACPELSARLDAIDLQIKREGL